MSLLSLPAFLVVGCRTGLDLLPPRFAAYCAVVAAGAAVCAAAATADRKGAAARATVLAQRGPARRPRSEKAFARKGKRPSLGVGGQEGAAREARRIPMQVKREVFCRGDI